MNEFKPKVLPKAVSVIQGSPVELLVQDFQPAPNHVGAWWIPMVDAERTHFMMASSSPFSTVNDQTSLICEPTKDLAPGLYLLAKFALQEPSSMEPTQSQVVPLGDSPILFNVVACDDHEQTASELLAEYEAILVKREADFHRGFGCEPTAPGAREYIALVFVRDCLLTNRLRLGQYQAIPFEGSALTIKFNLFNQC